jgi:hypothetical protein
MNEEAPKIKWLFDMNELSARDVIVISTTNGASLVHDVGEYPIRNAYYVYSWYLGSTPEEATKNRSISIIEALHDVTLKINDMTERRDALNDIIAALKITLAPTEPNNG